MNPIDHDPNGVPASAPSANGHSANRVNAQHSTGPRTVAGKKRSSLNALRHGLTGHTIVLPSEDLAAYERHCQAFFDEFHPQGPTESHLVQSLADTAWRINRIPALEANLLSLGMAEQDAAIDAGHPEAQAALAMAAAFRAGTRAFALLSTYSQRLSRQFDKTLALLREIQAERRNGEQNDLERAANLVKMHQLEDRPYDPAKDGFVFSNDQIQTFLQRRDRDNRAYQASHYLYRCGAQ